MSCCPAKVHQVMIIKASQSLGWEEALRNEQTVPEVGGKVWAEEQLFLLKQRAGPWKGKCNAVLVPFGLERQVSSLVPAPERWFYLVAASPSLPPSLSHAGSATSISWLTFGCTRKSRVRQQRSSVDSGQSLSLSGFVCFPHQNCSG